MEINEEMIGQIIDIFEDNLQDRDVSKYGMESKTEVGEIPLHFEDEDSDGVFYGGEYYNKVAGQLKQLLKNWNLIKEK